MTGWGRGAHRRQERGRGRGDHGSWEGGHWGGSAGHQGCHACSVPPVTLGGDCRGAGTEVEALLPLQVAEGLRGTRHFPSPLWAHRSLERYWGSHSAVI